MAGGAPRSAAASSSAPGRAAVAAAGRARGVRGSSAARKAACARAVRAESRAAGWWARLRALARDPTSPPAGFERRSVGRGGAAVAVAVPGAGRHQAVLAVGVRDAACPISTG